MSDLKQPMIKVESVHKRFLLPSEKTNSLKQILIHPIRFIRNRNTLQTALKNINFDIEDGEFFGIVGRNGSGKSTLLKILAGIYQPTEGRVRVNGRLMPFIELGVGFNPDLTGRENVFLSGALLGFSHKEIASRYKSIVEFAELEKFMEQRLKNYSSGMQVRLAFSIAIQADADILLIDEVLAVGDQAFQRKCFEYFRLLKKQKKTVVFVTHDMGAVREYCDRAMLIDNGKVVYNGKTSVVSDKYFDLFAKGDQQSKSAKSAGSRTGSFEIQYKTVTVDVKKDANQPVVLNAVAVCKEDVSSPVFGFAIKNSRGDFIAGTSTKVIELKTKDYKKGDTVKLAWNMPNIFNDGSYSIDVAIQTQDASSQIERWNDAVKFTVFRRDKTPYPVNPVFNLEIK